MAEVKVAEVEVADAADRMWQIGCLGICVVSTLRYLS